MPYNYDQGLVILTNTIQQALRHQDYKRTCEIAKMYTAFVTGEDVESLLVQFAPRESHDEFKQRVALTKVITDYMAYRLMTPMFKVPRTPATKHYEWQNSDTTEKNKKILEKAMGGFAGDESLDDYLATAIVLLDSTDPNAFIVTDFEGVYDPEKPEEKPEPYPFEVSSEEAINYEKLNNILQFLIVLNACNGMKRYTMYLENDAIIAQEISRDDYKANKYPEGAPIIFKDPVKKDADEIYYVLQIEHKAGRIPAIQIGTRKDLKTRKRTYVPLIHPARSFFLKSIKAISECDLTMTLHAFPQKFQYDSVCPGDPKNQIICNDGRQMHDNALCPICKGTGFNEHKSAQSIIRVKMPADLKDVVSLENFSAYKYPPTEILEFMKKLGMYEYPELALKAVYSTELFTPDAVMTTATAKNIDLESVYDTLKPFSNKYSTVWMQIVHVLAAYLSIDSGFNLMHVFPKDFKMKSLGQLLKDLTDANASGAPSFIKNEINRDIARKMYMDNPDELIKLSVKDLFYPFNGKTETEIATIITNSLTTKYNMILYANFDNIFDELDQENSNDTVWFYKMERSMQQSLLEEKVQEFIDGIDGEAAQTRAINFRDTVTNENDPNNKDNIVQEPDASDPGIVGGTGTNAKT